MRKSKFFCLFYNFFYYKSETGLHIDPSHITAVKYQQQHQHFNSCLSVFPSDLLTLLYHEQISHFERTEVLVGKTHFITTALISNPALVRARRVFLSGILSQDLWDHSHRKCAPLGFSHAAIQSRPEIPTRSPLPAHVIVGRYFSPLPHNPIPVNSFSDSSGRKSGKSLLSIIPAFHTPPR